MTSAAAQPKRRWLWNCFLRNALAAGNHVMLKPSEFAPRTAELLRSIAEELFSTDHVTVILGKAETGSEFSRLPFDHLLYTGSGPVGKLVMRAAAENLRNDCIFHVANARCRSEA